MRGFFYKRARLGVIQLNAVRFILIRTVTEHAEKNWKAAGISWEGESEY